MPSSRPARWLRLFSRGPDPLDLPGLLTASEFERLFQREKALADRGARSFSLVVIDPRGDAQQTLRLCEVLSDRLRGGDAVGRLDSRRIAVLLAGTDAKGAWTYADDLLKRLAEANVAADCRVYADLPYRFQGQGSTGQSMGQPGQFTDLSAAASTLATPESPREPEHPGQTSLEFPDDETGPTAGEDRSEPEVREERAQAARDPAASPDGGAFESQKTPGQLYSSPFAEGNTVRQLEPAWASHPLADSEQAPVTLAALGSLMAFPERLSDMAAIRRDLGERPVESLEEVFMSGTPWWKRGMDIVGSAVGLLLLAPVLAILAVLVRLSSPGPIIFRQQRVGAGGRPFTFFKFRSMYLDAEARKAALMGQNEADGPVFKIKNDPRVTPIGRILRRYSLDELPQLWNVLKGDMSLVGPRPPTPDEVPGYQPWQRQRLRLKGGLTCTWQVSGRSDVSFEEWMRMDARYARGRGLRTDLRLIFKTISAMFTGRGAY